MTQNRWFISYQYIAYNIFLDEPDTGYGVVVTDMTPAKWILKARLALARDHVILYAEEISLGLAVELAHGGAGVSSMFLRDLDEATNL